MINFKLITSLLVTCYLLLVTSNAYAVDLESEFGFGNIKSLGEGFSRFVIPGFAIASIAVVFYIVIGAVRIIASGGDKEAVSSARNSITHGIIGFVLLILMFLIILFIQEFFELGRIII